ncbi:MAG: RNA polymerase sigma factor [Sandaracinaceae bacterium]|nr:RNA polymerase sigma factor [Sandaracinaceae bacterium]
MSGQPTQPSDEELVRRFNEGDATAFETLLLRYQRPLFNFILRSVRRRERADEILQDVFLRVIQRSHEFKGNSKFSTWLYTIARNLCIDDSRKMVFRRHKSLDAPSGRDEDGPSLLERTAAPVLGADRETIGKDLQERIGVAIDALPEDQREVFLMRQVQGMAFKDIAEVVGVPENTVKSRMRYALERLQRALEEYRDYAEELK